MKIILVNPPSDTYRTPEEHLGLCYIMSFLASRAGRGYFVEIIDGYLEHLDTYSIIKSIIEDADCKVVGLSPYIDSLKQSITITEIIKLARPDIHICWGGHLATFSAAELLSNHAGIDSIVRGEGEQTFLELVQVIGSGDKIDSSIKGLALRNEQGIILTPARNLLKNLDLLPFPSRASSLISYKMGALAQISGSRGCYGNCSFCSINSLYRLSNGKAWRGRSAKNIVGELVDLYDMYGLDHFKFVDDSFFGPDKNWRKRGTEIAERIIKSGLPIRFRISARSNNIDWEVFQLLKEAGLYAISIGIESGVQRMLDTFNKNLTVEQNQNALDILKELGIITLMGFIGFDPYVTLDEIIQNIEFLEKNSFVLTDLLSKSLYVHADDAITKTLIADGLITDRDFPNYQYKIIDDRAALVLKLMQEWNLNNKSLYYKISDPLTAPRRTTLEMEKLLLRLTNKLREVDLTILKEIVKMVQISYNEQKILKYLKDKKIQYLPIWNKVETEFLALK